jgi:nitrate reductase NapD
MNICGILVHAFPDRVADVATALQDIPGSELHGCADDGRLIVTIEDTATSTAVDGLASIHAMPGVVAAALVYHQFEPDESESGAPDQEA